MFWVTLILQILGPAIGEVVKRLVLKVFPKLSKEDKRAFQTEFRQVAKKHVKKSPEAPCGYEAKCDLVDTAKADFEALEKRWETKVS